MVDRTQWRDYWDGKNKLPEGLEPTPDDDDYLDYIRGVHGGKITLDTSKLWDVTKPLYTQEHDFRPSRRPSDPNIHEEIVYV